MSLLPGLAVITTGNVIMLDQYKEIIVKVEKVKEQVEARYREIERIADEL